MNAGIAFLSDETFYESLYFDLFFSSINLTAGKQNVAIAILLDEARVKARFSSPSTLIAVTKLTVHQNGSWLRIAVNSYTRDSTVSFKIEPNGATLYSPKH